MAIATDEAVALPIVPTDEEVAIRNAMVASTALTQRRRELIEVEEFLARHRRQYDARVGVAVQRDRSA